MNQQRPLNELDILHLLKLINRDTTTKPENKPYLVKNGIKIIL